MRRITAPYYIILFILISVCQELKSQDLFTYVAGERIKVCTDRTMYISGEKVMFSAIIFNVNDSVARQFSRIFYCELITPDGKKIAGRKYLLQNSSGQGCFIIPEETISGIYFLKFYTRFMRNISTGEYNYIMLKIVNPFKTEVLSGNNSSFDTTALAVNKMEISPGAQSVNILSGKQTFSPREEIRLTIQEKTGKGLAARLCLSVVPELTYEDPFFSVNNKLNAANNGMYSPETRGISLSGQLIGKESREPLTNAKVNLSIIGDKDFQVVRTDSSGRFFFALPDYKGNKDIFLCADDLPGILPEILIDNDFCSRPVFLPSPRFALNSEEMKTAYNMAINFRIASIFRDDTIAGNSSEEENTSSFYGNPSEVLVMQKYIDLPTLEEYFAELPVMVKLRKVEGRKQFRFIYKNQAEMSLNDPLVLIDWVAVNNMKKILAMLPPEIERIELVDCPYVKGDVTYGGIISFVSKKNDFAGIDLPTSGTFVNYKFLDECNENIPPALFTGNIPDSRNTVYWNPSVQTNDDGSADISFLAPDTPGKYYILLRGMTKTGEVELTKEVIVVTGN
ncbi:MAG: hypothetical protein WCK84_02285 [Bacteroidota bacterium]